MRLLNKINKGFALTIIVLLVLIIYIVTLEIKRNSEKPIIEEVCKDYIELINRYAVLPENTQKLYYNDQISSEEKTKVEEDMKKAISRTNERT